MTDRKLIRLKDVRDIPYPPSENGHPEEPQEHSWQPHSLIDLAANPPQPPTIGGLLYPGKRTVLSGETESMKTWLALILCKAELDLGLHACWVDLDAMGPAAMLERLRAIGVDQDAIDERFLYIQPSEMLDLPKIDELADTIHNHQVRLCIIDAFNPILNLHGLDPNSVSDVEKFWRTIADPICQAGAAPVLLDHVVKNAEARGKYASGSERKASGAIVHLGFKPLEILVKGGRGRSLLTVHKDRPGYLTRPTLGRLILSSDGTNITYQIEADKSHDQDGGFRPTVLMEKVSRYLEEQPDQVSRNQIENGVIGNRDAIRTGLDILVDDAYATRVEGPRRAQLYTSNRPFREAEDTPKRLRPPLRPDFAQDLRSTPQVDFAQIDPLRGRRAKSTGDLSEVLAPTSPNGQIREYDHAPPFTDQDLPFDVAEHDHQNGHHHPHDIPLT